MVLLALFRQECRRTGSDLFFICENDVWFRFLWLSTETTRGIGAGTDNHICMYIGKSQLKLPFPRRY